MKNLIKKAMELGNVEKAKHLVSELLKQEHKAEWDKAKRAEYELLYPTYREATDEEYTTNFIKQDGLEYDEYYPYFEDGSRQFSYFKIEIDYSEDENYVTYEEWINETIVVSEAVEATYDDEGLELTPYVPEVKELVRPYTPLEITDQMLEEKLNEFRDVKQEALDYLASTDWYVVRYAEKGIKVPVDIINNRQLAREKLN